MAAYNVASFVSACKGLVSYDMTFDEYVKATDSYWQTLARYIYRRWATPAGVTVDDVYQEVLLGLWIAYAKYEEGEGRTTPNKYLYWNAGDKAKRFVHKQRGAIQHGSKDRNPSRIPVPFSAMGEDGFSNRFEESIPDVACLEAMLVARSEAAALAVKANASVIRRKA